MDEDSIFERVAILLVGRDRGAGTQENRGREFYGRKKKRVRLEKRDSQGDGNREKQAKCCNLPNILL